MGPDLSERVESAKSDLLPEIDHGVRVFDFVPVMEEKGDLDLSRKGSASVRESGGEPTVGNCFNSLNSPCELARK
jgi:hypothetical protein